MTTRKRSARNASRDVAPKVDPETYEVGTWAGIPNFGCPLCPFRTLDGTAVVVTHIADVHRTELSQANPPAEAPAAQEI